MEILGLPLVAFGAVGIILYLMSRDTTGDHRGRKVSPPPVGGTGEPPVVTSEEVKVFKLPHDMFWDPIYWMLTASWPTDDDVERMRCQQRGTVGHTMCGFCWRHMLPRFICIGYHLQ